MITSLGGILSKISIKFKKMTYFRHLLNQVKPSHFTKKPMTFEQETGISRLSCKDFAVLLRFRFRNCHDALIILMNTVAKCFEIDFQTVFQGSC